jgi:uncharacterized protein YydD (DUF2326 family)
MQKEFIAKRNLWSYEWNNRVYFQSKIAPLCISIETVEVAFFHNRTWNTSNLGVEMSTGGPTKPNVSHLKRFSRFIYEKLHEIFNNEIIPIKKSLSKSETTKLLPDI